MSVAEIEIQKTEVRSGRGHLQVEMVSGQSSVTSAGATSPLKLLTPRARGKSAWAYSSSFGGGLVAGDQTRLDLRIGPGARCFFGTQASTKVYRNPNQRPCSHQTVARLDAGSLLVFAPDPVQAFADSTYRQQQEFDLAPDAGLVLLDWFTSGRVARGERWAFAHFQSRNEVRIEGERVFIDSILLDPANNPIASQHRAGRFNCFAMLLLLGPPLQEAAARVLAEISSLPVEPRSPLACSASPIRNGALLRVAGESVEQVGRELHRHLRPLAELLGDDPWERKW